MKKNKQFLTVLILLVSGIINAQMVLEYDIEEVNTKIALPLAGSVNVIVDWGDSTLQQWFTREKHHLHTYVTPGKKIVTITGTLTGYGSREVVNFNVVGNDRLTKVLSWNSLGLISFENAFFNAHLLEEVPDSIPPSVTSLSGMFNSASNFNQSINSWDVRNVTNMSSMFAGASSFNQPLDLWDVSNVTRISNMFSRAISFNQPLNSWDVSNVESLQNTFRNATSFNQPLDLWDVSSVFSTFKMFLGASNFNQSLGEWNISNVTNMSIMFLNAGLCTEKYDSTLIGWASQSVKSGVDFHGGNSTYLLASAGARDTLLNKGWDIIDGGLDTDGSGLCGITVSVLEKEDVFASIELFPNPAQERLQINFANQTSGEVSFEIYDLTGRLITSQTENLSLSQESILDVDNLAKGNYLLKITSAEGTRSVSFVKE